MSHELRTPLNAIIGFSQLQARFFDDTTPPKLSRSRDHILHAGKHLLTLIEDILDVVKIEQKKRHPRPQLGRTAPRPKKLSAVVQTSPLERKQSRTDMLLWLMLVFSIILLLVLYFSYT